MQNKEIHYTLGLSTWTGSSQRLYKLHCKQKNNKAVLITKLISINYAMQHCNFRDSLRKNHWVSTTFCLILANLTYGVFCRLM